ncbi:GtrA family protein [Varibaculum vaginae]|uniref:GtrA family protein n=1 Tax=Varibaculum vaginae TaxID=2364797 RepID=UPI002E117A76
MEKLYAYLSYPGRVTRIIKFCLVGGMNYLVDVSVFNLLMLGFLSTHPLTSKVLAATVATIFSWVINRYWTFRNKRTNRRMQEFLGFAVVNVLGMLPAIICLGISHYLFGFSSLLADNISANVIGLALGTILRFFLYEHTIFTGIQK